MRLKERKIIYQGRIISLYEEIWTNENKIFNREIVVHQGAACALPYSEDTVYLVRQFRAPLRCELLEIPAGLIEPGENPENTALRETEEETGHPVIELFKAAEIYSSPGFSNEVIHIYFAKVSPEVKYDRFLDEDEFIEVAAFKFDEFFRLASSGLIKDGKTLLASLLFKEYLSKKE
ncbi:MAG: NUDIX hydrolase [Actinobacteria bacterium]|nr:NUDIX hydrolase [Actinomycetota bacterium]